MAFVRLMCKAAKIEKLRRELEQEKKQSVDTSQGKKVTYSVKQRYRHFWIDLRNNITKWFKRKCTFPKRSCMYRTMYNIKHDGSCENFTWKSVVGFASGFFLTYIFFMFFVFQLNFKLSTATIMCSFFGSILTIGLAFSYKVRCVVFLLLPQFFSKRGRQALMAYAFILAITGPAKNTLHNMGILSESLACGQEQLKAAVRQIIEVVKKPFYAIRDAIRAVVKTVKVIIKKIKEILLTIKRVIMAILRVIKAAFQFLAKLLNICNKELGTPFQRCMRSFEGAITDCNAKLGPLFNWLCSITYLVQTVCYIVKIFDFICMIVDFISDSIIGVVVRKIKIFIRHIRTMFYVRIKFSHSFHFETNQSKSMSEITTGIITEVRHRTDNLLTVFDIMSCATSLFFLFIILRVLNYRYKFLTSDRFDNRFVTRTFREIDMKRAQQEKETVLPFNHRERALYISVSSMRLVKIEKVKLSKAAAVLGMTTLKLSTHMMADYALYWVLTVIRYHARFQSTVKAPNIVGLHIEGNGFLANLLKSIVKAFQPLGISLEIDTIPCLPDPIPPDYDRYIQIASLLVLCWILTIFEPYGLRLRHSVMCFYHPTRARQRAVWLYNHVIRSRSSFLKFARRQLRRKITGEKGITKITCKEYLRANINSKWLRLCLGADEQSACLLCGDVFRESDPIKPIRCIKPGCPGIYCEQCYADLQNLCTICLEPIQYGDISDISEEKDSSADEAPMIEKSKKKKRKNKCTLSKCCKKNQDQDSDDEGGGLLQSSDSETSHSDYSSGSTDNSYSYQKSKDITNQSQVISASKFSDVEKQRISDYASWDDTVLSDHNSEEIIEEVTYKMKLAKEKGFESNTDWGSSDSSVISELRFPKSATSYSGTSELDRNYRPYNGQRIGKKFRNRNDSLGFRPSNLPEKDVSGYLDKKGKSTYTSTVSKQVDDVVSSNKTVALYNSTADGRSKKKLPSHSRSVSDGVSKNNQLDLSKTPRKKFQSQKNITTGRKQQLHSIGFIAAERPAKKRSEIPYNSVNKIPTEQFKTFPKTTTMLHRAISEKSIASDIFTSRSTEFEERKVNTSCKFKHTNLRTQKEASRFSQKKSNQNQRKKLTSPINVQTPCSKSPLSDSQSSLITELQSDYEINRQKIKESVALELDDLYCSISKTKIKPIYNSSEEITPEADQNTFNDGSEITETPRNFSSESETTFIQTPKTYPEQQLSSSESNIKHKNNKGTNLYFDSTTTTDEFNSASPQSFPSRFHNNIKYEVVAESPRFSSNSNISNSSSTSLSASSKSPLNFDYRFYTPRYDKFINYVEATENKPEAGFSKKTNNLNKMGKEFRDVQRKHRVEDIAKNRKMDNQNSYSVFCKSNPGSAAADVNNAYAKDVNFNPNEETSTTNTYSQKVKNYYKEINNKQPLDNPKVTIVQNKVINFIKRIFRKVRPESGPSNLSKLNLERCDKTASLSPPKFIRSFSTVREHISDTTITNSSTRSSGESSLTRNSTQSSSSSLMGNTPNYIRGGADNPQNLEESTSENTSSRTVTAEPEENHDCNTSDSDITDVDIFFSRKKSTKKRRHNKKTGKLENSMYSTNSDGTTSRYSREPAERDEGPYTEAMKRFPSTPEIHYSYKNDCDRCNVEDNYTSSEMSPNCVENIRSVRYSCLHKPKVSFNTEMTKTNHANRKQNQEPPDSCAYGTNRGRHTFNNRPKELCNKGRPSSEEHCRNDHRGAAPSTVCYNSPPSSAGIQLIRQNLLEYPSGEPSNSAGYRRENFSSTYAPYRDNTENDQYPLEYCPCDTFEVTNSNQRALMDDEVSSYSGYSHRSEFPNLVYQNTDDFFDLVNELGDTLSLRNRERVQKAMKEFELMSRQNKNLEKPLFDTDSEDRLQEVQKHHHCERPMSLHYRRNRESELHHNTTKFTAVDTYTKLQDPQFQNSPPHKGHVERVVQHMDRDADKRPQKYPKFKSKISSSHWEMNPRSGEWYKVFGDYYEDDYFVAPPSIPPPPRARCRCSRNSSRGNPRLSTDTQNGNYSNCRCPNCGFPRDSMY